MMPNKALFKNFIYALACFAIFSVVSCEKTAVLQAPQNLMLSEGFENPLGFMMTNLHFHGNYRLKMML